MCKAWKFRVQISRLTLITVHKNKFTPDTKLKNMIYISPALIITGCLLRTLNSTRRLDWQITSEKCISFRTSNKSVKFLYTHCSVASRVVSSRSQNATNKTHVYYLTLSHTPQSIFQTKFATHTTKWTDTTKMQNDGLINNQCVEGNGFRMDVL